MGNTRATDTSLLSPQVSGSRYFFLNPGAAARRKPGPGVLALGGCEHCNPDYRVERDGFAYHVIEYIVEGAGWVRLGGGAEHTLGPGSVFVCAKSARCVMRTDPAHPLVKYFLCVSGRAVLRRLAAAGLPVNRVRTLAAQGEARSVLEDLVREGRRPGARAAEICAVLFELLRLKTNEALAGGGAGTAGGAGGAGRRRSKNGGAPLTLENFQRCKAIIDESAERLVSLEEIAVEARLDVSSVCRLFRRFQGISPYQYLLRRKMNIAAEFLVDGGGLVKEAAQRVGFADALHFSRVFRAVHGVPPSGLRRPGSKKTGPAPQATRRPA